MLPHQDDSRYALQFTPLYNAHLVIIFPDNSNALYFANPLDLDVTRSILDHSIARLEESARALDGTRILDLEESARALKSCRNGMSPISRLPVDILRKIFSLIEDTDDSSTPYPDRSPESWTNFSQVSQHWRSSALSAEALWTNIPLSYPRWAEEMLIRSKTAKLTIRSSNPLERSNPKTIETVRLCLHEISRVEEIDLTERDLVTWFKIGQDLDFPKSAPQLHTLCLGSYSTGIKFGLFVDCLLNNTELLRHVKLIRCSISWESRLLSGLTHLTLEKIAPPYDDSLLHLLHALQRMPALIELHIKNSLPDSSEDQSTFPNVDLLCLRVLHVSFTYTQLTIFLRQITFPHSAMLNLSCGDEEFHQTLFSDFIAVLDTKFLSSLAIRRLTAIERLLDEDLYIEFYFWTTAINQDGFPSSPISQSQLQLVLRWSASPWPQFFLRVFSAMNLHFLTQLRISTKNYIDDQTWVNTFGKLPLLERVYVESYATWWFFDALVYKADKSKTAYCNVSFPKLRYIHLNGTDFATTISVNKLLYCLMERYERNAEVQVLRLDDCYNISFDDVARLREVVVDVIWDGLEQRKPKNDEKKKKERVFDSEGNNIQVEDLDYDNGDYICKGSCSSVILYPGVLR